MSKSVTRSWAHQVFIAADQLLNAILAGWADETLSARAFRLGHLDERLGLPAGWWLAWKAIDWLFTPQDWLVKHRGEWTGARHCERAFYAEKDMKQNAPEYRPENAGETR